MSGAPGNPWLPAAPDVGCPGAATREPADGHRVGVEGIEGSVSQATGLVLPADNP